MRSVALLSVAGIVVLVACSSPKSEPGIPITGVVDSAVGDLAPLTAGEQSGTGFSIVATLGSEEILVSNGAWKCYTPAPPQYPNFDIEATDGATYGFFISINPGYWGAGTNTIDGETVTVALVTQDRAAIATAGTLTLTSAGSAADTTGNWCKFDLVDVPMFGERDPQ